MATAYIPTAQIPTMMGQSTFEIDPITQQAYHTNYMPGPGSGHQQIFLTSGQPVHVFPGNGGGSFPPVRFHNTGPGGNMFLPSPNIVHMPYAGDLHAPPAYSEMDSSRFPHSRSRRSSFSANYNPQFGYPGSQMGPSMGPSMGHSMGPSMGSPMGPSMGPSMGQGMRPSMTSMDYNYVDSCMFCQANHPGPHPHGPSMNTHDMPPMSGHSGHRHMSMDDNLSSSSKVRSTAYSYDMPMYDPFDWSPNSRRGRESSWDNRSKPRARSRSQGAGNRNRRLGLPYDNNHQISEPSDGETEDDVNSRVGRNYQNSNATRRPGPGSGPGPSRPGSRAASRSRASLNLNTSYM